MRKAFQETGDATQIWDGHFAGREREVFIVQQLTNLKSLPAHGFKVGFFPMKLAASQRERETNEREAERETCATPKRSEARRPSVMAVHSKPKPDAEHRDTADHRRR
jgi:hypothetical protein